MPLKRSPVRVITQERYNFSLTGDQIDILGDALNFAYDVLDRSEPEERELAEGILLLFTLWGWVRTEEGGTFH